MIKIKKRFRRGNGVGVLSAWMITYAAGLFILLITAALHHQKSQDVQNSLDMVSDGTALYMGTEGEDESDALEKIEELSGYANSELGVDVGSISLDASTLEDDTVTLSTSANFMLGTTSQEYTVNKTAATQYTRYGATDYLEFAIYLAEQQKASDGTDYILYKTPAFWVNEKYIYERDGHGYFDCSGFVSYVLYCCGYNIPGHFGTDNEPSQLKSAGFTEYPFNAATWETDLQPGDILHYYRTENTTGYGHTEIYVGDGMLVGARTDGIAANDQVSVHTFNNVGAWRRYYRYTG